MAIFAQGPNTGSHREKEKSESPLLCSPPLLTSVMVFEVRYQRETALFTLSAWLGGLGIHIPSMNRQTATMFDSGDLALERPHSRPALRT
jgi:hypothetical protein